MPYKVSKSGKGYKVKNKKTGKTYSKKPLPKKRAEAQMKAIYANTNESFNKRLDKILESYEGLEDESTEVRNEGHCESCNYDLESDVGLTRAAGRCAICETIACMDLNGNCGGFIDSEKGFLFVCPNCASKSPETKWSACPDCKEELIAFFGRGSRKEQSEYPFEIYCDFCKFSVESANIEQLRPEQQYGVNEDFEAEWAKSFPDWGKAEEQPSTGYEGLEDESTQTGGSCALCGDSEGAVAYCKCGQFYCKDCLPKVEEDPFYYTTIFKDGRITQCMECGDYYDNWSFGL